MTTQLLPPEFLVQRAAAVRRFWASRDRAGRQPRDRGQGGQRDAVTHGRNMDGFVDLVRLVAQHCGLAEGAVIAERSRVVLPGYFRATKSWDVLVFHERRLLAAFEFKSQAGSFGNNFNNRSEEAIGSALDLWVAHREGAYHAGDPRPPFLGWLMLLEECTASTTPVKCDEPHFPAFLPFRGASYATRYQLLCDRLMEQRLYDAAALLLSDPETQSCTACSPATSVDSLFTAFAARMLTLVA